MVWIKSGAAKTYSLDSNYSLKSVKGIGPPASMVPPPLYYCLAGACGLYRLRCLLGQSVSTHYEYAIRTPREWDPRTKNEQKEMKSKIKV